MQMQRFEISLMNFQNCRAHLDAAVGFFFEIRASEGDRLLEYPRPSHTLDGALNFPSVVPGCQLPGPEQGALRLSTGLLVFDDVIASTILNERPRLYEYHERLLSQDDSGDALLKMDTIIGCPNWVLLNIGKSAVLNAWKHRCQQTGSLDVLYLAQSAAEIRDSLLLHLTQLQSKFGSQDPENVFEGFRMTITDEQRQVVAQIWAHAALVHLLAVASGWQPANTDIRAHVDRLVELLSQLSPPSSLRAVIWPFYITGCFADDQQGAQLRSLTDTLRPRSVYGTVTKVLEVLELVWEHQNVQDGTQRDLWTFLRSQGDFVLLV